MLFRSIIAFVQLLLSLVIYLLCFLEEGRFWVLNRVEIFLCSLLPRSWVTKPQHLTFNVSTKTSISGYDKMFIFSYWQMIQRTSHRMVLEPPSLKTMERYRWIDSNESDSIKLDLINTKLPIELLKMIFMMCTDYGYITDCFSNIRLVCKPWACIITPLLLEEINVIPHLMCLDRLLRDIQNGHAIRLHMKRLNINVHGAVNVAMMVIEAYQRHGFIKGLTDAQYVQLERNKRVQEREVRALVSIFQSLDNLQSVDVNLKENQEFSRSDGWDNGRSVQMVQRWLDVPHWSGMDYLDRRNYHFEDPPILHSILYALAERSSLADLTLRDLNIVWLRKSQYQEADTMLAVLQDVISRQEKLALGLEFDTFAIDESNEFVPIDEDEANYLCTHGPSMLLRYASRCKVLHLRYTDEIGDPENENPQSQFSWVQRKTSPIFPHVVSIHLTDFLCTPQDLLELLTFHSPSLRELYLQNIVFVPKLNSEGRREAWTRFLKQLKARTRLTKIRFNTLLVGEVFHTRHQRRFDELNDPDVFPEVDWPDAYVKTIEWFLSDELSDESCPLNAIKDTESWSIDTSYSSLRGEGFVLRHFAM